MYTVERTQGIKSKLYSILQNGIEFVRSLSLKKATLIADELNILEAIVTDVRESQRDGSSLQVSEDYIHHNGHSTGNSQQPQNNSRTTSDPSGLRTKAELPLCQTSESTKSRTNPISQNIASRNSSSLGRQTRASFIDKLFSPISQQLYSNSQQLNQCAQVFECIADNLESGTLRFSTRNDYDFSGKSIRTDVNQLAATVIDIVPVK